ncbi:MAG: hypothetical protein PHH70_05090 [Candidatus Gracilibacteria bacterium]|nr:hypothetical protein [Candidatus Gracilibacteria bacterium]
MSENNPTPHNTEALSSEMVLSPEVAAILEKAHAGATDAIRFASHETSLYWAFRQKILGTLNGASGGELNPQDYHEIVVFKKEYNDQLAAKDEKLKQVA